MSRHPLDRVALVLGIPVLAIGLYGVADDTGLVDDTAWIWIALAVAIGVVGLALAVTGELRARRRGSHDRGRDEVDQPVGDVDDTIDLPAL